MYYRREIRGSGSRKGFIGRHGTVGFEITVIRATRPELAALVICEL